MEACSNASFVISPVRMSDSPQLSCVYGLEFPDRTSGASSYRTFVFLLHIWPLLDSAKEIVRDYVIGIGSCSAALHPLVLLF